jgi:hypothetical protein
MFTVLCVPQGQKIKLTLLLVRELYTFSTGSETAGSGRTQAGWAEEEAFGASVIIDILNERKLQRRGRVLWFAAMPLVVAAGR